MSEPSIEDYTIGWICALQEEYEAACRMLDDEFDGPETSEVNDNNTYAFGCVAGHHVVVGCLPDGRYGTSSAAGVARDMVRSFPNLRFALMVGIGGGAPTGERDIRLGDVVVSVPQGGLAGVVQYDFGKRLSDGRFQRTSQLNAPPQVLLGVIPEIRRHHNDPRKPDRISEHLKRMDDMPEYRRPTDDRLYRADYEHKGGKNCANCEAGGLEERPSRKSGRGVIVHYGIIASANSVMKNATERDQHAKDPELNVLCFEMEAGGLMNNFPCLVVRGICDYSDTHKNDDWHNYAALAAAAYARELLHVLKPRKVTAMPSWAGKMETILAGIQEEVSGVARKADNIIHNQRSQEEDRILEWLTPVDYGPQQSDYLKRRQPGTGQWLLDSSEYRTWLNSRKQTLFCPGIPGAGKTILTSILVDDLCNRFYNNGTVGIAYIYCNFRRKEEQKIDDLLASLLKQLVQSQSSLPADIKDLYNRHHEKRTRPSSDEIARALQSISALYSQVFIVVDALDECQSASGCRSTFLSQIFSLQAKTGVNSFATSRPIPDIEGEFKGCLRREILASDEDVRRYLDGHMQLLPKFILKRRGLQEEIKAEITRAVEGMFLLAQLYLDSLKDKTSVTEMRCALGELQKHSQQGPENDRKCSALDQAYHQAMERIDSQMPGFRLLGRNVLLWIICAKRSLTTSELQHALAVKVGNTELDKDNIREVDDMISVCAGLVTVDRGSGIIRLVHYTAQEYFEQTQKDWFPNAEAEITAVCATYLSFRVFGSGFCRTNQELEERLQSNPLYGYVTHNWGHHARAASILCPDVINFLECDAKVQASSQALMAVKQPWYSNYSLEVPRQTTGLHLAAYFGIHGVVEALLGQHYVDVKDSYGRTPLSWASQNGYEAFVKLLLENGASTESRSKYSFGRTPLSWAAEYGHEAVVKLLLEEGADIESKDRSGWTPLSWAAEFGHDAVVKLLLERGTNLKSKDIKYDDEQLLIAVQYNHKAAVKLLLDKCADIHLKDNSGRTLLSRAARSGHEAIVKLLLDNDANAQLKDYFGRTPMSWAALNGYEAVVQLLLDKGSDIDLMDDYGRTPLSLAAGNGHEAVTKLLLEQGASAELKDNVYGRTPLSWAAENGYNTTVKLLLDKDADLESKSNFGRTPLSWAAASGHEAVIKLLLERGASTELKDEDYGRTPLSYAAAEGHEAVVKLLLEKDANVEAKDDSRQTPLSWAAEYGHEAIVQLLLEKGSDVDSTDNYGRTPLLFAIENGHEAIIKLLLKQY